MLWLKFLHIGGLLIWVAGLLYLPSMFWAHHRVGDQQEFARIRMASRFAYMGIVSPAAFVAVGAGLALLFLADALHPWMFLKLIAVGVLVMAHMQYGYVLGHLATEVADAPTARVRFIHAAVAVSVLAIFWLVLAKPDITTRAFPEWLTEPGILTRPQSGAPPAPPPPGPLPRR